jgi:XTP/dITP diphosphohydrolase
VSGTGPLPAEVSGAAPGARLLDLVVIVDTLRLSCPWDREQTHESLLRYLLEEVYEAAETIEAADLPALREEIGDVLFQVLFHARIASERPAADGGFTIDDVADTLAAKLIRRHPHVFAGVSVASADDVAVNWEEIKKAERSAKSAAAGGTTQPSVLDGVPFGQPALALAAQLQRRAARAGFVGAASPAGAADSPARAGDSPAGAGDPSAGAGDSPVAAGDLGAQLMALVAQANEAGLDPEVELRAAARRFADQVRAWERSPRA